MIDQAMDIKTGPDFSKNIKVSLSTIFPEYNKFMNELLETKGLQSLLKRDIFMLIPAANNPEFA
jgi:hypothetical protein